jgi:Uncharacterized protein conserved in bacteria
MANFLKQNTSKVISFGPFVSPSDGVTLVITLVSAIDHASTGIMLSKSGGAKAVRHATVTASTYDAYGDYLVTLDTTDTNTLGSLRVSFAAAASCCPVWRDFMVVPANVYDALVGGTDLLDTQTAGMDASVITAAAIATDAIDADAMAANAIDAAVLATGAITAAKFAAGAIDAAAIADNAIDAGALAAGAITSAKFAAGAINAAAIATDAVDADALSADAIAEIIAAMLADTSLRTRMGVLGAGTLVSGTLTEVQLQVGQRDGAPGQIVVYIASGVAKGECKVLATYDSTTGIGAPASSDPFTNVPGAAGYVTFICPTSVALVDTDFAQSYYDNLHQSYPALQNNPLQAAIAAGGITGATFDASALAAINDQVLDVMSVDQFAELAVLPPATNVSMLQMLQLVYQLGRNKSDTSPTQRKLYKSNDVSVLGIVNFSDNGTTLSRGKFV